MAFGLPATIFALLAVTASGFVLWPILRERSEPALSKTFLAAAVACAVIGIGAGPYLILGRPEFAARAFERPEQQKIGGLVALLVQRVHKHPGDIDSWVWLGRAYNAAFDSDDAAKAFGRAVALARDRHALSPELLSAYGEALIRAANGAITPEAESIFKAINEANPKDVEARYFLGFAHAERGEAKQALAFWQSALADLPSNSPLAHDLKDRMALLASRSGNAPDIASMVASLSQRLEKQPNDPEGWRRLIRAWSVLGDRSKAQAALARAREKLIGQPQALAAINAEARELHLQ